MGRRRTVLTPQTPMLMPSCFIALMKAPVSLVSKARKVL